MNTIKATLTPNAVGLVLCGSEHDLMDLYDAIYQALPEDDYMEDENIMYLLGLTYDIRKAYSGYREEHIDIQPVAPKTSDACTIETAYSVTIVLPILIVQLHILSEYLDPFQGDEQAYKVIMNFKNVVLNAIKIKSKDTYEKVSNWLETTDLFSADYIFDIATHFSAIEYIQFKPVVKRLQSLPALLRTFEESNQKYQEVAQLSYLKAKELNCRVHDLRFDSDDEIFEQLDNGQINW